MSETTARSRAEHHADSDPNTVRNSRRVVRRALERHAIGRDNALSGAALAGKVPLKATTVRDVVSELRDDGALPIGNSPGGYYVIDDASELDAWVEAKREEIATMRSRMETVTAAFNERRYGGGGE